VADTKLDKQARELLQTCNEAIRATVEAKLKATEKERQQRRNAQLQPIIQAESERIDGELRAEDEQRFWSDATAAELARIRRELKAKEK
jgi:hypothetical protein